MRIAVTGASGLIGSALCLALEQSGYQVLKLVRRAASNDQELQWHPIDGIKDLTKLENLDAVVHLAGAGVGDHRWSVEYKREIRDSRVQGTLTLSKALASVSNKPEVLISASAIGWYGDTGNNQVDESTPAGPGFLADVVSDWEQAADPARLAGIRVVHPRTGLVLSPKGGALAKMLPLFRFGLGSPLGKGDQYWSFISISDEVRAICYLIDKKEISGPVNLTAPNSVNNRYVSQVLGRILKRPVAPIGVPAPLMKLVLGEFSQEVLGSSRVLPAVLMRNGFRFDHPTIEQALLSVVK
jgi:uncharacterized protein (TIGR01777 family)